MEFFGTTTKKPSKYAKPHKYTRRLENREELELYSNPIAVYDTPPNVNLSVVEFEKYALARLKVLRIIERINLTSAGDEINRYSQDWRSKIITDVRTKPDLSEFYVVLNNISDDGMDTLLECRKFDHISHYLLRLAFCQTEEQKKWFIALEVDLFRLKLSGLSAIDHKSFLQRSNFPGELVGEETKKKYMSQILNSLGGQTNQNQLQNDMYRVPFFHALELVRNRKVFLHRGQAFVPYSEIVSVISGAYRSHLSEAMTLIKKNMHVVEQDPRIMQVVADFDRRHTGSDFNNKKNSSAAVTAEQLPVISQKSFPLCMKSLYDVVVKDHHLKHFGRLQLGLFLKAVGMPLEEATKFWRGHFTKKPEIDGSRFDKQYLYNIRHMYGQEGKRADYTPYSCIKVITSNVGPGDFHGCPFKHSDPSNLRVKLIEAQIPQNGIKEIMEVVDKHHYQIACQKYFEYTHDSLTVEGGVNHPNQYFEESRDVLSGRKTIKSEEKLKSHNVKIYTQQSQVKSESSEGPLSKNGTATNESESMEIDDATDAEFSSLVADSGY